MRNVKVAWSPGVYDTSKKELWKLAALLEPAPMESYIAASHQNYEFAKCPAHIAYFNNTFLIRSPVDVTLHFDEQNRTCTIEHQNQDFYDNYVRVRWEEQKSPVQKLIVTLHMPYFFSCDEDVDMESSGISIVGQPSNTTHIVGKFNIHKWVRPIDWTFAIADQSKPIVVKRGDPLYALKFTPYRLPAKVVLERTDHNRISMLGTACTTTTGYIPNKTLKYRYEQAASLLSNIKWFK